MAFPTVVQKTVTKEPSNVTSHDFAMPAGLVNGNLLLGIFSSDSTGTISAMQSGWTNLFDVVHSGGGRMQVWYRTVDGTESDGTYTTSGSEQSVNLIYEIQNWHGTTALEAATDNTETSATPDPPNLNPTNWATEQTLWFTLRTSDGGTLATGYPTNFDDNQFTDQSSAAGGAVGIAVATRGVEAASQDPDTFTMVASQRGVSATIAVRPVAAGGVLLPERSYPRGTSRGVARGAA